ncbi:MAG: 3-dehydroquinate synthase [Oscillospiraceae bacterium]|nr:3-dehydroquinate synthase [Oscillospiraceae bacterium]
MKQLYVDLGRRAYDILIERGILKAAGQYMRPLLQGRKVAIVTDEIVEPFYGAAVIASLEEAGFQTKLIVLPPGEGSKTISMLETIYDALMDFDITRADTVMALGGGVIGDLAGFAAATILRGVAFVQIPTTLLAQVDSSVGGKVAVDLKAGKNLAGAFYQPKLVLIDPNCLDTLPSRVLADGMAEVIKYGAVFDEPMLRLLEQAGGLAGLRPHMEELLYRCCDWKRSVVVEDEQDQGSRMLLNFGHTLGHAYEVAYHYETYPHGQAVSAGMCKIARMQQQAGMLSSQEVQRFQNLVRLYELPTEIPCTMESYVHAILKDKKGRGDKITLILLEQLGKGVLAPMATADLVRWLQETELQEKQSKERPQEEAV